MQYSKKAWIYSSLIILVILLGNYSIYQNTRNKMEDYPGNPPFRLDDFTRSFRVSSASNLNHLFDNSDKTWMKLQEGREDSDIDMELRLTHFWDGEKYSPRDWRTLHILSCAPSKGVISLIIREAINVDKELRLPDDKVVFTEEFQFQENSVYSLNPSDSISLEASTTYPDGIYILVLRMKFLSNEPKPCLKKIYFE